MKILFSILVILWVNLVAGQSKPPVQKNQPLTSKKKVDKKIKDFRTPPSYYVFTINESGLTDTVMLFRFPRKRRK